MIWYLLYFLRGTTEPPVLSEQHPIRRTFTRYGVQAARHPVITLLTSIVVGTSLIYPFPFLYTNDFKAGASNLPHHVWTAAHPFEGNPNTRADVAMRSVWVHGNYMKALQPNVLQSALQIQDALLGPTSSHEEIAQYDFSTYYKNKSTRPPTREMQDSHHVINGLSNQSWFFYSPLQYWAGSAQAIANDRDIIKTVNEASSLVTAINITLRHKICFSGKRYESNRLVAADAIVITLIHMLDAPIGDLWTKRAEALAMQAEGRWRVYPSDGRVTTSKLHDFRFQPLSLRDDLLLGVAYTMTTAYFLISMSKLRALKSRFGLILAVCTQIGISILSSFTICAIFKIDLSSIPREAYPLVVLAIGLENMFRFINAVITTPAENSTVSRISEALGDTGHIALAGVTQNLFILWLLSKVVSPGVAAFCAFAAVALTFDFFYLLVFFVAVMSVEVRRTELSDSLHRAGLQHQEYGFKRQTWQDGLLQGNAPVSTRVAGSVVMIGFIIAAQHHFFDQENLVTTLARLSKIFASQPSELTIPINQARTPTSWLRLQDHETAREVIQVVKPKANNYLARVYDPLVFVLEGSDRSSSGEGVPMFLPAVYDFIKHQSIPFLVFVVVVVALISLLMNYLLWNEISEDDDERPADAPLLAVKTLRRGHVLDVALLVASPAGVVASFGLDRLIRIWDIKNDIYSYAVNDTEPLSSFSVAAMTLDAEGKWLGIVSTHGQIVSWNIRKREWTLLETVALRSRPLAFWFGECREDGQRPALTLVQHNGFMTDIESDDQVNTIRICNSTLVSAVQWCNLALVKKPHYHGIPRLLTASRHGCVHVATAEESGDNFQSIEIPIEDASSITSLPLLGCFLVSSPMGIKMVDIHTYTVLHTFEMEAEFDPLSLRSTHSRRRNPNSQIGVGITRFCIAYNEVASGDCVLLTFDPEREHSSVSLRDRGQSGKSATANTITQKKFRTPNPGTWELTDAGVLIGIRKKSEMERGGSHDGPMTPGLRRRGARAPPRRHAHRPSDAAEDTWEVWCLSSKGERATMPLCERRRGRAGLPGAASAAAAADDDAYFLVPRPGPTTTVGRRSVAVVFGNLVKIVTVGHERFDGAEEAMEDSSVMAFASRRRRGVAARRGSGN